MKPALALPKRGKIGHEMMVSVGNPPLYNQGKCKVCEIALAGHEPVKRDLCGNEHCQAEAKATYAGKPKKKTCKFKRLRNSS